MSETTLHKTALYARLAAVGARFVPFAGWEMPVQFSGALDEHAAVRETCGVFDVSHMGTVFVRGADAAEFLQRTLTNDVTAAPVGKAQYTMLCNTKGGVVDDLIVSHLDDTTWMVVPNAGNVGVVVAKLRDAAPDSVTIDDVSAGWGILAVQGPAARRVVDAVLPTVSVGRFGVARFTHARGDGVLSGTGYTGSPGVEIVAPSATIAAMWDGIQEELAAVGGRPCGLAARDSLRLEMGYPLHGQDLSPSISPLEAGLGWVVKLDKGTDFPGAEVLREQKASGVPRRAIGLVAHDRRPPRAHNPVLDADGGVIGEVTSGGYSPALERGIALALVRAGTEPASVDIRGRVTPFTPTRPPFIEL